jgi:transposase
LIQQDISRIKAIEKEIKELELSIRKLMSISRISQRLYSINGFGEACCSELAGEIGTIKRFKKEGALAIYLGMSPLDNSSGLVKSAKNPKQMNKHAKSAMMSSVDHHRKYSSNQVNITIRNELKARLTIKQFVHLVDTWLELFIKC